MKKREEYRYNPFDFDASGNLAVLGGTFQGDIALGLTLYMKQLELEAQSPIT